MNRLYRTFTALMILFSIGCFPATGDCDIASPTAFDAPALVINIMKTLMGKKNSDQILAVQSEFPRAIPIVIEANINYTGAPENQITSFEILNVWPGIRTQPAQKLGVKNFSGVVQIHGYGTGPRISRFPGMKISITPKAQSTSFCGVIHFAVVAEFNAWGKHFQYPLPKKFIQWDASTFSVLKVDDPGTGSAGRLTSRTTNEDFTFYPAQAGSHQISLTVDGIRATAFVNINSPELSFLELLPDWGALAGGTFNVIAMAHYEDDCKQPENVTNQVQWSDQPGPEAKAVKLSVSSPSHPSKRVELCEDVTLLATLTSSPGKKILTAKYEYLTSSMMVDDAQSPSTIDITRQPGLNWSTGAPYFKAAVPGNFTITATDTVSGLSASTTINVVPPASVPLYPLKSLSVPGLITAGDTITCNATPFSCNGVNTVSNIQWVSMSPDLIHCDTSGNCTAEKPGQAMIAVYSNGQRITVRSVTIKPRTSADLTAKTNNQTEKSEPFDTSEFKEPPETARDWRNLSDQDFVKDLYTSILDRSPDKSGYDHWLNLLASGKSRESCLSWFFKSPEYKSRKKTDTAFIIDVYQATFGRKPTSEELQKTLEKMKNGASRDQIVYNNILSSKAIKNSDTLEKKDQITDNISHKPCERVIGKWSWFNGNVVTFSANGTMGGNPKFTWHCDGSKPDRVTINWNNKWIDKLTLSEDGGRLKGKNQHGTIVWGNKM